MAVQSYKNHTRRDPIYICLLVLALLSFIAAIIHVVQDRHSRANDLLVPVTLFLLLVVPMIRIYTLKVQDRVIRLEEQTRLRLLGVDSAGITIPQFVALRFAADDEVGALAVRARAEALAPKQIKEAILNWRVDDYRV